MGGNILFDNGTIIIKVVEILNNKEVKGQVLSDEILGEKKNCTLPGLHVDLPVLNVKDIDDL